MVKLTYSKAFSEFYGSDFRRNYIDKFKLQNSYVSSLFYEIAIKRAEVVKKIPFDTYENNLYRMNLFYIL